MEALLKTIRMAARGFFSWAKVTAPEASQISAGDGGGGVGEQGRGIEQYDFGRPVQDGALDTYTQ